MTTPIQSPPPGFMRLGHDTSPLDLAILRDLADQAPPVHVGGQQQKIIVEIGSWVGLSAWAIMQAKTVDRLYCVDHWLANPGGDTHGNVLGKAVDKYSKDGIFNVFCLNMREFLFLSVFPLVGKSEQWARVWPAQQVSMVFIDGDHEQCDRDIAAWRPHIVKYGILCGHDYNHFPSVKKAVDAFALTHVNAVGVNGQMWWTRV